MGVGQWPDIVLGVVLLALFGVRQGVLSGDNLALRRGLAHLADTDPLTGLPNRHRLERDLDRLQLLTVRFTTLSLGGGPRPLRGNQRSPQPRGRRRDPPPGGRPPAGGLCGEDAVARIGTRFVVAMLGMGREDAVEHLACCSGPSPTLQEVDGKRVIVGASADVAEQGPTARTSRSSTAPPTTPSRWRRSAAAGASSRPAPYPRSALGPDLAHGTADDARGEPASTRLPG